MELNISNKKTYILYGGGGHAKVVKDAIEKLKGEVVAIYDKDKPYQPHLYPNAELIIAIGNNSIREKISLEIHHNLATVIHPSASIANDVKIGAGTVVFANAVVQAGVIIGKNCIINANTTIDHEAMIEDFVSIYPNTYIGGNARITKAKLIEPNTVVPRNTNY